MKKLIEAGFALGLSCILTLFLISMCVRCTQPPVDTFLAEPAPKLSWNHPEWNAILLNEVTKNLGDLSAATDIVNFCPKFKFLTKDKQTIVFAEILIRMMKYESAWNPVSRMQETTMGVDNVTKLPVYSEGLLQLSYGDIEWAKFCEFDWKADKLLPIASRSITDPKKNLACGIKILANQTVSKKLLAPVKGYWAVMNTGSKYTKVTEIQNRVKGLEVCK